MANKTVLIIEDDLHLKLAYVNKLNFAGFSVVWATTGQEGIDQAKKVHPNIIILDIMLVGGLNGYDVLEIFKRDPVLSKIPVIILTNLSHEEATAHTLGAVECFVKSDVSLETVVDKIKSYLQ